MELMTFREEPDFNQTAEDEEWYLKERDNKEVCSVELAKLEVCTVELDKM